MVPPVGRSGPGTNSMSSSSVAFGWAMQVPGGADDLDEVVRRHVRGHADRDAARAVDEQVRVGGRQHLGLGELVVVVRHEVDDVLVEALGHRQGGGGEPGLGVARRGGAVVERAEVAVAVDERHAQRERLRHAHEGVVDRRVAVRVQLAHHLADDARATSRGRDRVAGPSRSSGRGCGAAPA